MDFQWTEISTRNYDVCDFECQWFLFLFIFFVSLPFECGWHMLNAKQQTARNLQLKQLAFSISVFVHRALHFVHDSFVSFSRLFIDKTMKSKSISRCLLVCLTSSIVFSIIIIGSNRVIWLARPFQLITSVWNQIEWKIVSHEIGSTTFNAIVFCCCRFRTSCFSYFFAYFSFLFLFCSAFFFALTKMIASFGMPGAKQSTFAITWIVFINVRDAIAWQQ